MRLSTIIKGLAAILVVFVIAIGAILHKTDFNLYKNEIGTVVQALTDRKLVIDGKFKLTFGLKPALAVDRVRFSNAKWGSRKNMLRIRRLRAELQLRREATLENTRLRRLLGMREELMPDAIGASVVTSSLTTQARLIVVDRGERDG